MELPWSFSSSVTRSNSISNINSPAFWSTKSRISPNLLIMCGSSLRWTFWITIYDKMESTCAYFSASREVDQFQTECILYGGYFYGRVRTMKGLNEELRPKLPKFGGMIARRRPPTFMVCIASSTPLQILPFPCLCKNGSLVESIISNFPPVGL